MSGDPFTITFEAVKATAEKWHALAIRVPGHCVIILDDVCVGDGMILNFEDNPNGYLQAQRFAVRFDPEDIESLQALEEIEAEQAKAL